MIEVYYYVSQTCYEKGTIKYWERCCSMQQNQLLLTKSNLLSTKCISEHNYYYDSFSGTTLPMHV
jgi:hypothetical protein